MDVGKANSLKDQGNKAYSEGKYDEALDFYTEALESVGSEDSKIAAILHSNSAQTYLKKKEYLSAIESSNKALELDPSFKKSNLRRATANTELDNIVDAMKDLRLYFLSDPYNKEVKDLMRRCSDFPKMTQDLHEIYAKCYLRRVLKKLAEQVANIRSEINSGLFKDAIVRQLFLSTKALDIVNSFVCKAIVMFIPGGVGMTFTGWVTLQLMHLKYSFSVIAIPMSYQLFKLLYHVLRSGSLSLMVFGQHTLYQTGSLDKYSDVFLVNECNLPYATVNLNDLALMKHYSNDVTRLLYISGLANCKNERFPKAKFLFFDGKHAITNDFLKTWQKSEWAIERVSFAFGYPDLQILKQFGEPVSIKVNTVLIQYAMDNTIFHKTPYSKLCNNLSTLKGAFPNLSNVTIVHKYTSKIWDFPRFVQNMALVNEAYETVFTKPDWCPKLRVVVFVEFEAYTRIEFKTFNLKSLGQAVESLRQKRPDMPIRLSGARSYDTSLGGYDCVHAVIEFENEVAHFELAFFATMCSK